MRLDGEQQAAAARLAGLAAALSGGWRWRKAAPRGIYLHGGVGRGKTMLMDEFFGRVADVSKRRAHFHGFMQDVHGRLHGARAKARDAIAPVARAIAAEARLLCLDELQISDIADAMIVGRLFEALLGHGVVIVTTSNLPPDRLYADGLNRKLFLPFIKLLGEKLDVIELGGGIDYRLGRVKAEESFVTPLGPLADAAVQEVWRKLTDTERGVPCEIEVLGRKLKVPQTAHGCARFQFAELCEAALGPADYLALARNFGTVFVENIPILSAEQKNAAARFVTLIDALYDAKVRLVASAAGLSGGARTVSRLQEMQSAAWWAKKNVKS